MHTHAYSLEIETQAFNRSLFALYYSASFAYDRELKVRRESSKLHTRTYDSDVSSKLGIGSTRWALGLVEHLEHRFYCMVGFDV